MADIGQAIRNKRVEMGIKQIDMATRLGFSQSYYSKLERGEHPITTEVLERICQELETSPSFFLDAENALPSDLVAFGEDTLYLLSALFEDGDFEEIVRQVRVVAGAEYFRVPENRCRLDALLLLSLSELEQFNKAQKICLRLLETAASITNRDVLVEIYLGVGTFYRKKGDPKSAYMTFHKALDLIHQNGALSLTQKTVWYHYSLTLAELGRDALAEEWTEKTLDRLNRDLNRIVRRKGDMLLSLGNIKARHGDAVAALDSWQKALAEYTYAQNVAGQIKCRFAIAKQHLALDERSLAMDSLLHMFDLLQVHPNLATEDMLEVLHREGFDVKEISPSGGSYA